MSKQDRMRKENVDETIANCKSEYDDATSKIIEKFVGGEIPKPRKKKIPERVGNKPKHVRKVKIKPYGVPWLGSFGPLPRSGAPLPPKQRRKNV